MDERHLIYHIDIEIDEAIGDTIDEAAIRAAVAAALHQAALTEAALTIVLTTDDDVRALNAHYRGIDAPTDVLSFAASDTLADAPALAVAEEAAAEVKHFLGDLVIAYPYAARQAAYYHNSVTAELQLLAVHGTLHLLGYDHDDEESEAMMWSRQEQVLQLFGHGALARRTYD